MKKPNNPASRLHEVLSKLAAMPTMNPCRQALASALEVSPNDSLLLFDRIARMADLAQRAKEQVLASGDDDANHFLEWLPKVEIALANLSLPGHLSGFTGQISPVALENLRLCGVMLSRQSREPELVDEEIMRLFKEIDGLIEEVKASAISPAVRDYVLRHLLRISQALRDYRLFGAEPIRGEVEAAVGSVIFHPVEAKDAGERYWGLIVKIANLMQIGGAAVAITSGMLQLLSRH